MQFTCYAHATVEDFCNDVDAVVTERYRLDDGGDLCYSLIESGVIDMRDGIDAAARTVAQHIEQA